MPEHDKINGHGGELALAAMAQFGISEIFALSGGHVFPLYDAAVKRGWPIWDVRHEQTATFGAEGLAKLLRRPAAAVLTAGPGVTNGISAFTTASFNGTPLLVVGGRAAQAGWGRGALQEFDHIPLIDPVAKVAMTSTSTDEIARDVHDCLSQAVRPHRGPVFVDIPIDVVFGHAEAAAPLPPPQHPDSLDAPRDRDIEQLIAKLADSQHPALLVGSDVYWARAEGALLAAAEAFGIPVYSNGLGRGLIPADHPLAFSRTRRRLSDEADLVVVIGTPLDFRVGFGDFGQAEVVHVCDSAAGIERHRKHLSVTGDLATVLTRVAEHGGDRTSKAGWIQRLRDGEMAARVGDEAVLSADGPSIKPTRVYGELRKVLDRDAVVVCDGGDFVSYAGRYVDSYLPGRWMDPGPYGCLGTAMGYSMAARIAHPDAQVVTLLGDGAAGFSLMDVDTLVRHKLPVVMLCGNNGIWGLEKHPMNLLYGYDVAAELTPGTRYDEVVKALGGAGELVTEAEEIGPALRRAFDSGVPYLVNVLTDPADAYPRSSNLG